MQLLLPPPVVVMLLGAAMWAVNRALPFARIAFTLQLPLAIVLLVTGLLIAGAAAISFIRASTTINPLRPSRASQLITNGVFAFSRNPIYLGDLLILAALAVWLGNAINGLWLPVFVWYISRFQIAPEEEALTRIFGARYAAYCKRVRRWL